MNREAMLREMGITPLWKPRDAASDTEAAVIAAEPAPAMNAAPVPQRPRATVAASAPGPYAGEEAPPDANDFLPNGFPPFEERPAAPAARMAPRAKPVAAPPAAPAGVDPERVERIARMDWPPLKEAVAGCEACGLCRTRRNTVFGVGDEQADWMIIGEAPGAEEDAKGEPFVGQAGRLLDSMLASLEMKREVNIYIANVLKCRPPGNRNPEPLEVAQCSPHLLRQVSLIQPKLIILMGRFAAQTLLGTDASIASMRGRLHQYQGTPAIVTYHPAYLLRNLPDKSKAWQDLLFARRTYRGILDQAGAP